VANMPTLSKSSDIVRSEFLDRYRHDRVMRGMSNVRLEGFEC
jgi:hypothetical protein